MFILLLKESPPPGSHSPAELRGEPKGEPSGLGPRLEGPVVHCTKVMPPMPLLSPEVADGVPVDTTVSLGSSGASAFKTSSATG